VGWRANLDEGEPHGLPGSYLNGVFESRPLPYAERAYGLPETGQEIINVTNGKLIRLFVDDEPFDVRYGELRSHERLLDFRAGALNRRAEWVSPAGRTVRVSSARLVSLTQRAVAAICYEVEPLDGRTRIAVQSELLTNEPLPSADADPRVAAAPADPLSNEYRDVAGTAVMLVHKTRRSGLRVGAAMGHLIECPPWCGLSPGRSKTAAWSPRRRYYSRGRSCGSSSSWPTAGRAGGRCRLSATRCRRR
jgi:alpha,alpha-trehalose phosphorylase